MRRAVCGGRRGAVAGRLQAALDHIDPIEHALERRLQFQIRHLRVKNDNTTRHAMRLSHLGKPRESQTLFDNLPWHRVMVELRGMHCIERCTAQSLAQAG